MTTPIPTQQGGGECLTSSLAVVISNSQGALGSTIVAFQAENTSSATCTIQGYFGVEPLDGEGRSLGAPQPDRGLGWSYSEAESVSLHPRQAAGFVWQSWGTYGSTARRQTCPEVAEVELTAPDQADHAFIPARLPAARAIQVCAVGFVGPASASPETLTVGDAQGVAASNGFGLGCDESGFASSATLHVLVCHLTGAATSSGTRAFFFTDHYLGTDASDASYQVAFDSRSDSVISLAYRLYRSSDAACCPSLGTEVVRFKWDGTRLVALDPIPPSDTARDGHR